GERCGVEWDVRVEEGAAVAIGDGVLVEVRQQVRNAPGAAPAGVIGAAPVIVAVYPFVLELLARQVDAFADLLDREAGPPPEVLHLRRPVAAEIRDGQVLEGFLAIQPARLARSVRKQRVGELLAATRSAGDYVAVLGGRDEVR